MYDVDIDPKNAQTILNLYFHLLPWSGGFAFRLYKKQENIGAVYCIEALKILLFKKLVTTFSSKIHDCAVCSTFLQGTLFSNDSLHKL